eukprot:gene5654-6076_t
MILVSRFSWYLVSCLALSIYRSFSTFVNDARPLVSRNDSADFIHIGLTLDHYSIKDALLLINSIISSSINSSYLSFHIVAVERSLDTAESLKTEINQLFQSCFLSSYPIKLHYEILPYYLHSDSGFYHQMYVKLKKEKHHWNSPLGTDMIRFYLPELFPSLPRLLYIDNDIMITCCLEEVYFSNLQDKVIGIALDDLHWATVTQFRRHYNASHPLVIQHMRYNHSKEMYTKKNDHRAVEDQEFFKAVPRYPNDGVLLFNVPLYRKYQILESLNELAATNAHEYVVNIGTQQFTTLLMHDRWMELTPRANLRHFPNMARGYLMWFYYNGIIHYAGMFKPKLLCNLLEYKENFLRIMTFTPYIQNHYQLLQQCFQAPSSPSSPSSSSSPQSSQVAKTIIQSKSHDNIMNNELYLKYFNHKCPLDSSNLLILPENLYELFILFRLLAYLYNDDPYVYLRIGDLSIKESQWKYDDYQTLIESKYDFPLWKHRKDLVNTTFTNSIQTILSSKPSRREKFQEFIQNYQLACLRKRAEKALDTDFVTLVDQLLLFESIWSFRVYHPIEPVPLLKNKDSIRMQYNLLDNSIETMPKTISSYKNIIRPIQQSDSAYIIDETKKKKKSPSANERSFRLRPAEVCQKPYINKFEANQSPNSCIDILQDIKSEGRRHWEMASIVIDLKESESNEEIMRIKTTEEIVYGLDLIFMRPRIILIAFTVHKWNSDVFQAFRDASKRISQYLTRYGYIIRQNFDESKLFDLSCEAEMRLYIWAVRMNLFEL